jgi:hypothetical protein
MVVSAYARPWIKRPSRESCYREVHTHALPHTFTMANVGEWRAAEVATLDLRFQLLRLIKHVGADKGRGGRH